MNEPRLVQDTKYPQMWRVDWPDIGLSDMVNKTRAKDAIRCWKEYQRRNQFRRLSKGP